MRTILSLDILDAEAVADACRASALAAAVPVAIAVVDEAGVLLHFRRLEGARPHTVDLAIRKARTAALLGLSTGVLEQMAKAGRVASPEVLALGGGLPVMASGQCAGAVGVSGSTSETDERIAAAGLAVLAS